ncbi:YcfL [Elusimicrobium simillimum]|uniref:hypothetical protein n=1 Tax=Elusimicrobium simillimum TaxID=3143438 RepID=UPI003C6F7543
MKKFLVLSAAVLALAACSGSSSETSSNNNKYQPLVVDQEFDRVEAPKMDYDTDVSYEAQLKSSGTFVKGTKGKTTKKSK